jgi:exodeoxyribonuclease VII small subunit
MNDAIREQSAPSQPPSELSYPQAMAELEGIVGELDGGMVDIDTLGERFQRAIDIVEEMDARILRTRQQVEQLTPRIERLTSDDPGGSGSATGRSGD